MASCAVVSCAVVWHASCTASCHLNAAGCAAHANVLFPCPLRDPAALTALTTLTALTALTLHPFLRHVAGRRWRCSYLPLRVCLRVSLTAWTAASAPLTEALINGHE